MKFNIADQKFKITVIFWIAHLGLLYRMKVRAFPTVEISSRGDYYGEKKMIFDGGGSQFIKFEMKLPPMMDFTMCIWYKTEGLLENTILFSYGSKSRQLILWKIKKKAEKITVNLKILNTSVLDEPLNSFPMGQWNHLCQIWQGSTGFWAVFVNSYIVSFGYQNVTKGNWLIDDENAEATINHPRTKSTMSGEVYGFYLTSFPIVESNLHKRQINSTAADPRRPFPIITNVLLFVRRMVSFLVTPIFRFARALLSPWRRSVTTLRPTAVTETITDFRSAKSIVDIDRSKYASVKKNRTKSNELAHLELEDSMVIYEVQSDDQIRSSRNTNGSIFNSLDKNSNVTDSPVIDDKCAPFTKLLNNTLLESSVKDVDKSADLLSMLGLNFYVVQFFYNCCRHDYKGIMISWHGTRMTVNNVSLNDAGGCGSF